MKKIMVLIALSLLIQYAEASDSTYIRWLTDTLASKEFSGRGYVNDGMQKAAGFIAAEMKRLGLLVEEQSFSYPVNSFPGKVSLELNGETLVPGRDFLVGAQSRSVTASGDLQQQDSVTWANVTQRVIIKLVDKLTWTVSSKQEPYTVLYVLRSRVEKPAFFTCKIVAKYIGDFSARNIIGLIPGTSNTDSFIVITAHYDHLGMMGKTAMFAGANDNAGGVALMLSLAKYFQQRRSCYTVVCIAFAGEEAGLLGSEYFVNHSTIELDKIRFLLNLDLMGNGEDGITVVNATEFPGAFKMLQDINRHHQLLAAVHARGKARNSDHYWFTEKGVPSFFIYTLGARKAYHDIDDVPQSVPWFEANDLQTLLVEFVHRLSTSKQE